MGPKLAYFTKNNICSILFIVKIKIKKGFSIFELLIAITVLALLTAASYLVIPPYLVKARDAERKSDLHKIRIALQTYHSIKDNFPSSLPDCDQPLSLNGSDSIINVPCDPQTNSSYYYEHNADQDWFRIYTNLENLEDNSIVDVGCFAGCGPDCVYNYGTSSINTDLDKCYVYFACSPGGGQIGNCEQYDDPELSECPQTWANDPTCNNQCSDPKLRCKNASGKHVPD